MTTNTNSKVDVSNYASRARIDYVGTLVGESTSREFRLAVAREAIREQDIIAVDVSLRSTDNGEVMEESRLWAKVKRIERLNSLFPVESGHELAETRTNPFDTVLSLSREMITAVCQVLGSEPVSGNAGKMDHVRYPPQPATQAYKPSNEDLQRVVLGKLAQQDTRALDIATLSNRHSVKVSVDGHAIVTRHLAILAMTGAGKSWTARRVVEQLANKNYPIVIFDPHGEYTGLADIPALAGKVKRYFAQLPVFEEDSDKVVRIVESLAWKLADNQRLHFSSIFNGAKLMLKAASSSQAPIQWLANYIAKPEVLKYGIQSNLFFLADFVQALVKAGKDEDQAAFAQLATWCGRDYSQTISKQVAGWIEGLSGRLGTAAKVIRQMEVINRRVAGDAEALPLKRTQIVNYGQISIISLAGYTSDFQATIYTLIADEIFRAKVQNDLVLPVMFLLEEAHNFVPAKAMTSAEERSIAITKQIAQEGRKFNVGLTMVSQRPSRLDETTLAMCNSYIIMRMINPADQNFVRKVIESLGEDDASLLPDLDVGEAIISGQLINFPVLVKITPPISQGAREEEDAFVTLANSKLVHEENQRKAARGK